MVKGPTDTQLAAARGAFAGATAGVILTIFMTVMSATSGKDVWYGMKGASAPLLGDRIPVGGARRLRFLVFPELAAIFGDCLRRGCLRHRIRGKGREHIRFDRHCRRARKQRERDESGTHANQWQAHGSVVASVPVKSAPKGATFLPFSPCGRRCRSEAEADEGYVSAERDPSSVSPSLSRRRSTFSHKGRREESPSPLTPARRHSLSQAATTSSHPCR